MRALVAGLALAGLTLAGVNVAEAEAGSATPTTTTTRAVDPVCVEANQIERTSLDCTLVQTATLWSAEPVTDADVASYTEATGDESLAARKPWGSPSTVLCKTWSQSIGKGLWQEKHTGKMCYNSGPQVWVWAYPGPHSGRYRHGWHYCDQGYGVAYSVDVKQCNVTKVVDSNYYGGYFRQNWDRFQVHVVASGVPIYKSFDMHVNVFPSGTVTFHY